MKKQGMLALLLTVVIISSCFLYKSKKKQVKIRKVLFVGDSMTTITNKEGVEDDSFETYPNKLKKPLKERGIEVDVLAIAGKTTSWMKENLEEKLKNNKYDDIFIFGGVNDTFRNIPLEERISNIQSMVDLANKNGAKVYVIVGYNTGQVWVEYMLNPYQWGLKSKSEILDVKKKYIEYQKELKNKIKNTDFIEFKMDKDSTYDGVHPNSKGNMIIASDLYNILTN